MAEGSSPAPAAPAQGIAPNTASADEAALFEKYVNPEVKAKAAAEKAKPKAEKAAAAPLGGAEDIDTGEINTAGALEGGGEPDPKQPEATEAEGQTPEESIADDFDKFAEQLGVEPEALANHVKVKVGDATVPLSELVKGYRPDGDAREKALAENTARFEAEVSRASQTWQAKIEQADAFLSEVMSMISQEPDWQKLYAENPMEYVRQKEVWREHKDRLGSLVTQRRAMAAQAEQEFKGTMQQRRADEQKKLVAAVPEWKDPAKAKAVNEANWNYAKSLGFTMQEFDNLVDHRAYLTLNKARLFDELQKTKPGLQAKLAAAKLPPVLKPGARRPATDSVKAKETEARKAILKKPKDAEAGAMLMQVKFDRHARKTMQ